MGKVKNNGDVKTRLIVFLQFEYRQNVKYFADPSGVE